jgi:pimeloyl-ACP methyl ester carboxylesterase
MKQHGAFEFLKTATPKLFSPVSKEKMASQIDAFLSSLNGLATETLVAYYEAMIKRPDSTDILKTTDMPVLFVIGKHDAAIPADDMLKQSHMPAKSSIHILRDSGHMGMMEETAKTNQLLQEFLSQEG